MAKFSLLIAISLLIIAISVAFTVIQFYSYALLGGIVSGLSAGAGILFTNVLLYLKGRRILKPILLSLIFIACVSLFTVADLSNLSAASGVYHLNIVGEIAVIPGIFSMVALFETLFLYVLTR